MIDEQDPASGQAHHIILVVEITRVEFAAGLAVIERVGRIRRAERDRAYSRFMSQLAFTFVTGDTPLIAAAQAEELLTDNPFDHLSPSEIPGRSG